LIFITFYSSTPHFDRLERIIKATIKDLEKRKDKAKFTIEKSGT